MSCKIYKIKCNITGNIYVGSSKLDLEKRISLHISNYNCSSNSNCSSSIILQNNDYFYEIIEECDLNNRKERERYYINHTENCINTIKLKGTSIEDKRKATKKQDDKRRHCPIRKEQVSKNKKRYYEYQYSWGGDKRFNNNLLLIDVNLFKQ